ncbi:ElaA protein [Collimonas sp. PA-H2]|uniref:GNAT family N-acetyltransferase n=1 Tax=Collimonas sp. PA-H2 TaxID=1881062 RepID=UPI000C00D5D9|nr:GNAT family N-acetyltransferase [Collimonas sp. PA-H2]PFH11056.1 ElaA protein [Collimonas sp. PA-H2]
MAQPAMMEWRWLPFQDLSAAQLYAAMQLRQRVFVVEQTCVFLDADGIDLESWHGLGYLPGGELGAYARIVPPGKAFRLPSIGRVVTAPELRGKSAGHELMQQAMAQTAKLFPGQDVKIGAQAHLQRFYGRFGFAAVGELYDEDGIAHIHMIAPPALAAK